MNEEQKALLAEWQRQRAELTRKAWQLYKLSKTKDLKWFSVCDATGEVVAQIELMGDLAKGFDPQ